MPRAAKGSTFERAFARQLSLWWSSGESEDHFWRVGGSGGRATVRGKAGRSTANGYGDIGAQTKDAQDLLDLVTFELKRGYPAVSLQDLLERPAKNKLQEFIGQAKKSASLAGSPFWALVHKKDRRDALAYTNYPGTGTDHRCFECGEFVAESWFQVLRLEDFLTAKTWTNLRTYSSTYNAIQRRQS